MKVFDLLRNKALSSKQRIVFPEGEDSRILKAAVRLTDEGIITATVLGNKQKVHMLADQLGLSLDEIEIIDPENYSSFDVMMQELLTIRKNKNTEDEVRQMLKQGSYFGTMLVKEGHADGMVSGAAHSTADTVRPALQIIKTKPGMRRVSGSFIMEKDDQKYIFADCAINIDPDAETLAEIAYQSAETAKMIGLNPKVAFLSFSTKGSARGKMVEKVVEANQIFQKQHPNILADGELQFDAAFVPAVAAKKAPNSKLAGHANVFVFPELQSGNIGYKMVQRLAGFTAVGPILQGLAAPVNDLSRGASEQDVYNLAILTAAQAVMKDE